MCLREFCSSFLVKTKENQDFFYSSESSNESVCDCPPLADEDDDDRIGPDNFKNDDKMPPEPALETLLLPSAFESSAFSVSPSSPTATPALPPKLPLDAPLLNDVNFFVIAAIFGEMTA